MLSTVFLLTLVVASTIANHKDEGIGTLATSALHDFKSSFKKTTALGILTHPKEITTTEGMMEAGSMSLDSAKEKLKDKMSTILGNKADTAPDAVANRLSPLLSWVTPDKATQITEKVKEKVQDAVDDYRDGY